MGAVVLRALAVLILIAATDARAHANVTYCDDLGNLALVLEHDDEESVVWAFGPTETYFLKDRVVPMTRTLYI